ncbi:MAG: hypothetical protein ACR2NB_02535 [Solirubrobacteraceae bacterium]
MVAAIATPHAIELDATAGAADRAAAAAIHEPAGEQQHLDVPAPRWRPARTPAKRRPALHQLLFAALHDAGLPDSRIEQTMRTNGARLTDGVVRRLHASVPIVVQVHDLLGFWATRPQPFTLAEILQLAETDPFGALQLADTGHVLTGTDPRPGILNVARLTGLTPTTSSAPSPPPRRSNER